MTLYRVVIHNRLVDGIPTDVPLSACYSEQEQAQALGEADVDEGETFSVEAGTVDERTGDWTPA